MPEKPERLLEELHVAPDLGIGEPIRPGQQLPSHLVPPGFSWPSLPIHIAKREYAEQAKAHAPCNDRKDVIQATWCNVPQVEASDGKPALHGARSAQNSVYGLGLTGID